MITLSTMQSLNESVSYNPYDDIPLEDLGSVVESATAITLNEGIGHDIWEGIKALWSKLVELVRTLVTKIKNFFSNLFNKGGKSAEALKAKADKIPDDAVVNEDKALGKPSPNPRRQCRKQLRLSLMYLTMYFSYWLRRILRSPMQPLARSSLHPLTQMLRS